MSLSHFCSPALISGLVALECVREGTPRLPYIKALETLTSIFIYIS
ncbi:MAG: hypothetical protein QW732_07485 [Zestosphaera sp.]